MRSATGEGYVIGRVVEKREYGTSIGLVLTDVIIGEERVNGKLVAYLDASYAENIGLSEEIILQGKTEPYAWKNGEFVFSANALGDNLRYRMSAKSATVVGHSFDLFLFIRARALSAIEQGMDTTPAAVTKAVLFGDTYGIEADLYDNIRMGGIAHIFAVSGLHVGALFGFCLLLMRKTPLKHTANPLRFLTVAALLFIYAGVCGFSASVVRAMVICLISYLGRLLWVKTDFLQSLGAAAIIILLFTPSALFEVGFQLSFAACLGLALLTKPIGQVCDHGYKLYRKIVPIKRTEEQLAILSTGDTLPPTIGERVYRTAASFFSATTAAQIATAPLLLHYFGYLSGWATLLNCLFVPLISALFSALLVFVVLASILPAICASVVLFLPNAVWSALLLLFQAVDFSSFALSGLMLSAGACVCYYAACVFSTDKWNLDTKLKYILSVTSILGFVATMVVLNV